jgi:ABC-2 type transport system permease protein
MFNLLKTELLSRRNAILGWGIGLILFGAMYIAIYPEMAGQLGDLSDISIYEAMGVEMATFEGFLASTVVQYIAIILGVYGLIAGTGTLAGEEDNGTLELLLATPLPRWQIVLVKALALAIVLLLILAIAGAGNAAVLSAVEIETDVAPLDLFMVTMSAWPIVLLFTMLSLFLGAYLPSRRAAASLATVVYILSYFGDGLAGMVNSLEPIRPLSPFYHFESSAAVFTEGIPPEGILILLGAALAFLLLAILSFSRRNVTVGAWPWQRA